MPIDSLRVPLVGPSVWRGTTVRGWLLSLLSTMQWSGTEFLLYSRRLWLKEPQTERTFGFLYVGYRSDHYA